MLHTVLGPHVGTPQRMLDVGSADGPSVGWLTAPFKVSLDLDPRGLQPPGGVCGSVLALPFADGAFEVAGAFDVLEHCDSEEGALAELRRVLEPGGRLLMSVPAYQWAWTDHDVRAGHHRRYTRPRLLTAVQASGFVVRRCSYGFAGVFPAFAAERLLRRVRKPASGDDSLPQPSPLVERALLGASRLESRWLRSRDLPFGSSIFLAAEKPV